MSYEADLDQDYAAQAANADKAIANLAAQAANIDVGDANADLAHDDNISVNSNELAALGHDEMDDEEMMKMLNGDDDDDTLKDLMGSDDDMEGFDMDDPDALEKLTNPKKKAVPPSKAAATAPAPAKPTTAPPKTAPAASKSSPAEPTPKTPVTKPVAESVAESVAEPATKQQALPPGAKPTAKAATTSNEPNVADKALMKQREEEYKKVVALLNENITDLKGHVTLLLKNKNQTEAAKFLPLVKQAEAFLQQVSAAKKANEDVPPYSFAGVALQEEKIDTSIAMDDVVITAVNIVGIKHTAKYSLNFKLLIGKEQSHATNQVKGKEVIEFNEALKFTVQPSNIRASQNGQKLCKLAKCAVELRSHGMLWGSETVATGDIKCSAMQTKCESVQTVKLRDGSNNVFGELEVKLNLHKPFISPEMTQKVINIVKPLPKQAPVAQEMLTPTAQPTTKPTTSTATTPAQPATKPAPATTTSNSTPAAATTPAATKPIETDPDKMTTPQILQAAGWGLGLKQFNVAGELPPFVSFDNITSEIETLESMIKTAQFKRRLDATTAKLMINELESRKFVLETQVERGVMTFDDYLKGCKEFLPTEVKLEQELMKIAKWYKEKKVDDEARYYFELALWVKKRHTTLATEIKNAEENAGELEDE